jgi:arylsulfatase A-like enzyme
MIMDKPRYLLGTILFVACLTKSVFAPAQIGRPNIIFLLADDLGYSDIEPYGSEVNTPSLSMLAEQGIIFTNYHTAANCAPSRAMLLTGVNNHLAGVPNIPETFTPEQKQSKNYQGVLGDNVVTIATLLEDSGYHTYMAGKWHLGSEPNKLPSARGFERTVALMDSGADNWEQRPYLPIYDQANWFSDGERYSLPDDFYSSRFLIDKTIEFIDENLDDGKPFFAYVPFQAVHIPVQAPKENTEKYLGVYDEGWSKLREDRHQKAIDLGLVSPQSGIKTMPWVLDWSALSKETKKYEAKRMAVYAGMIDAMDFNIGRLIKYLRETNQLENTVFIFTSDNGAEGSGASEPNSLLSQGIAGNLGYNTNYETLGEKGSYNSINPGFTSAAVSPLSFYKFYTGEGGMRVPLIISGETLGENIKFSPSFAWATDVARTVLSLAEVEPAGARYRGKAVLPMTGRDLGPVIRGESSRVYSNEDVIGYELTGHSALFKGDYKLVRNQGPLGDGNWALFDIVNDPGETKDLKQNMPDRFQEMLGDYAKFEQDHGVLPPPAGYSQLRQMAINALKDRLEIPFLVLILSFLVVLPFFVYAKFNKRQ